MSTQEKPQQSTSSGSETLHPSLRDLKLGVWRVVWEQGPSTRFKLHKTAFQEFYATFKADLNNLSPFFKEVYDTLGLWLLAVYFTAELWGGFGSTALLVFSNKVLKAVGDLHFIAVWLLTNLHPRRSKLVFQLGMQIGKTF